MPGGSPEGKPSAARNIYAFGITSFLNDTATEMAYWVLPAFLASLGAGPTQLGLIEGTLKITTGRYVNRGACHHRVRSVDRLSRKSRQRLTFDPYYTANGQA